VKNSRGRLIYEGQDPVYEKAEFITDISGTSGIIVNAKTGLETKTTSFTHDSTSVTIEIATFTQYTKARVRHTRHTVKSDMYQNINFYILLLIL
jgi:hypothetical protein